VGCNRHFNTVVPSCSPGLRFTQKVLTNQIELSEPSSLAPAIRTNQLLKRERRFRVISNKLRRCRSKRRWQMLASQPTCRRFERTFVVFLAMLTPCLWSALCLPSRPSEPTALWAL